MPARGRCQGEHRRRCGPRQGVKPAFLPAEYVQDAATMRGFPFLARCAACLVHPAEPGKLKLRRCAAMRRACLTSSKKDMKGKNIFSENGEAAMEKKDALRGGTDEK